MLFRRNDEERSITRKYSSAIDGPNEKFAGKDMVVQASPGLERMVLLVSSILEKLDLDDRTSQAIVIAPTTDVSLQVCIFYTGYH